jgi:hypothetical protein
MMAETQRTIPKLGILAGGGELPARIVAACEADARPYFIVALTGAASPDLVSRRPHAWLRIGRAAEMLRQLRLNGVAEIVMAGAVKRPTWWSLRPDWPTLKFYVRIGRRAFRDDSLLRAAIGAIEAEGFRVVGAESLLHDMLAPAGPLGAVLPDAAALADIAVGLTAARELGAADRGQAVVVQGGHVLAKEGNAGTDALIAGVKSLQGSGPGGVLVKTAKPGQERRADLPTIGPRTVAACADAGLIGIAIEAGSTILIDRAAIVAAADRAGIFVIGVAAP